MTAYRVQVRIELHNEDYGGKVVLHDVHDHFFEAQTGANAIYDAIEDAVLTKMASLSEEKKT